MKTENVLQTHFSQVTNQQTDALPQLNVNHPFEKSSISSCSCIGSFFGTIWQGIKSFFAWIFSCFGCSKNVVEAKPSLNQKEIISKIADRDGFVWFYKKEENPTTAFLGNFHPCFIELSLHPLSSETIKFQCAEAAFQAAKFIPQVDIAKQFCTLDGQNAWELGRKLTSKWNGEQFKLWNAKKIEVMSTILEEKFKQNPELKELLLATKNAYLIEHSPEKGRDKYWSDDNDGTGSNRLGILLMTVRRKLGGEGVVDKPTNINHTALKAH